MKIKIILFIIVIIITSCNDVVNEQISMRDICASLPKFPQKEIEINTYNYIPNYIGLRNAESRNAGIIRDSLWADDFGKTLFGEATRPIILDNKSYYFIGALFNGKFVQDAVCKPITANMKPITVSVSLPVKRVSGTIEHPSMSATRIFTNSILNQDGIGEQIAGLSYNIERFTAYDELKLAFESNASMNALFFRGSSSSSEKIHKISRSTGIYVKFVQSNFTLDMDLPSGGSLISNTLTQEQTGGYSPIYINSVTYGRMGVLTIESDYDYELAEKYVKEAFNAIFINKQTTISKEAQKMIDNSEMKIVILGGDADAATQTVNGLSDFIRYIKEGGKFSSKVPGVPISCSFAYLSDNSPVKVRFKYNISTDPLYARIEYKNYKGHEGHDSDVYVLNSNEDIYISFYRDKGGIINVPAPKFVTFNLLEWEDNQWWGCDDEDSDKSVTPIKKVNSYLQNSLLLGSQVQTHKEQTPWDIVDDICGLDWYIYRTGYELLPGAFYKVLPTKCDIHGSTFHHRR